MKSRIKELLSNQHWMIHDLVDGEKIENEDEEKLYRLYKDAEKQYNKIEIWLLKTHDWFENNDNLSVNSYAYKELDKIVKEIR